MSAQTMMLSEYGRLREEFLSVASSAVDEHALSNLKREYGQQIRSNRKLSRVKELGDLVGLLERYDMLGHTNIDPLCAILKGFATGSDLQNKLLDYRARAQTIHCPLYNMYKKDNDRTVGNDKTQPVKSTVIDVEAETSQGEAEGRLSTFYLSKERSLQEAVLQHISERIGRSWRDAARFLGVREADIDAIENKYPFDLKRQSYVAFRSYLDQCPDSSWKINMIQVLEKARRRDLRESVEKMLIS